MILAEVKNKVDLLSTGRLSFQQSAPFWATKALIGIQKISYCGFRRGEASVRLTFPACDGTEPRATTPLTIRLFPFTDVP